MHTFCQFEQKVTLNFSLGTIYPFGETDYVKVVDMSDYGINSDLAYVYPYIMSNFDPGILFTSGVQFNFNRRFSLAADIAYFNLWDWTYQYYYVWTNSGEVTDEPWLHWELTSDDVYEDGSDEILKEGDNEFNMFNLSFGLTPKVYMAPGKKANPFLFFGGTLNYTSLNFINNKKEAYAQYNREDSDFDPLNEMIDKSYGVGIFPGLGMDFQVNENLGLFLQGGYSMILLNESDMNDNDLEPENFKTIRIEAGVKISFLKSKDY